MSEAKGRRSTIRLNGREQSYRPESVTGLLARLNLDGVCSGIAVAVNGEVVPRGEWERRELLAGDEVEVVGAVQGG